MKEQKSQSSDSSSESSSYPPDDMDPQIVRKISLEEFQPKGTLVIALIYFLIVAVMWVFMYFVEFAGHGPSIME